MIPVMQRTLCKLHCQVIVASLAGGQAHAVQGVHPLRQIVEVLPASATKSSQEDPSGGHQCPWPDGYIQAWSGVRTRIVPVTIWHMLGIGLANPHASQQRLLVFRGAQSLARAHIAAQRLMHLCDKRIRLRRNSRFSSAAPPNPGVICTQTAQALMARMLHSGTLISV